MTTETFVYNDLEVRKTGRVARKPMPGGREVTLEEITPLSESEGTWKKFVAPGALFVIDPES